MCIFEEYQEEKSIFINTGFLVNSERQLIWKANYEVFVSTKKTSENIFIIPH